MWGFLLCVLGLAGSVQDPSPGSVEDWKVELRSRDAGDRRRAVRRLLEIGTHEAWDHVLEALEDPQGQVADEVQLALPRLHDPRRWRDLMGKGGLGHDDPWVRVRVAEALARVDTPPDARPLLRALDPRDPRTTCAVLRTLAARGADGWTHAPRSWSRALGGCLRRRRQPRVRAEALAAWAVLEPLAARDALSDALGDDAPAVRVAALLAHQGLGRAAAHEAAQALVDDPDPHVRWAVVESLGELADRRAVEHLVTRLELEPRERILRRIVTHLQSLAQLRHRRDPRPWRDWLAGLPAGWVGDPSAAPPGSGGESSVADGRMPITSDRVAILVDLSGSIWNVRADGTRRKDAIDAMVHATLEALPDGVRFQLVPFAGRPLLWSEDGLVTADRRSRLAARRWYDDRTLTGPGDLEGAVRWVLEDPEVDTLCVLTDGAPTGGRRWHLELMVRLLLERTRHAPVSFDLVLVDAPRAARRRWGVLTRASGGTLTTRSLE